MNKEFDYNVLDEILKEHNYDESHTVTILQEVQAHYSYLPKEAFPYLAEKLGVPEAKIYGVATFYENFSLEPKGTNIIRCCTARPATFAIPPKFLTICARNSAFPQRREQRMTLNSPLKQFHVSAHAVLHRSSP